MIPRRSAMSGCASSRAQMALVRAQRVLIHQGEHAHAKTVSHIARSYNDSDQNEYMYETKIVLQFSRLIVLQVAHLLGQLLERFEQGQRRIRAERQLQRNTRSLMILHKLHVLWRWRTGWECAAWKPRPHRAGKRMHARAEFTDTDFINIKQHCV
jgi:hypothetical protein